MIVLDKKKDYSIIWKMIKPFNNYNFSIWWW